MVLADTSKGDIGWKKWVVAGWAFMECLLFGGLLYGWANVVFVLKSEGVYADLCPSDGKFNAQNETISYAGLNGSISNETGYVVINGTTQTTVETPGDDVCNEQDSKMTLCFTIGSALFNVGCAVLGHINYKFGTRVTRILSFICFIMGSLMMAFISKDNPWLMFPGLSLLGIGGLPILVTNTQVSNLFVTGSSSVVGLLCGAFDMSSAVMLIVKIAAEKGFSRKNMFIIITALHSLFLVSTFFFLPKDFIKRPEVKQGQGHTEIPVTEDGEVGVELLNKEQEEVQTDKPTGPTLLECVKKPMFITHVIWLSLLQLRFYIFIGTLNQYLTRVLNNDEDLVSYFTNICFSIMIGGLVTSFLSGIMYDWQKNMCKDGKSVRYREVMPAVLPLATASLLGALLSILVLIPDQAVLYVTFVILTMFRSFLYSLAAAFISALFPSEFFGMLYGLAFICAGLFGFLQYGFFKWTEAYTDGPFHSNIFLILVTVVSLLHPVYLGLSCWKEERKFKLN